MRREKTSLACMGASVYESFFKLTSKPFNLLPDPDFLYLSRAHQHARTYLEYGIQERAGFILLTGDVGSGKTTLIRDLLRRHNENLVLAKIFNTQVDGNELLKLISADFGLDFEGKEKPELLKALTIFLIDQFAQGAQTVLVVDEAQNLPKSALEEIRLLSNLESDHQKLLQIVLVGQPELRRKLADPGLVQLRQRISVNCTIKPLSLEETEQYIRFRLEKAGNREAVEIRPEALSLIHTLTRGIPRLTNILCDYMLLSAYAAQTRTVDGQLVSDLAREMDFEAVYWGTGQRAGAEAGRASLLAAKRSLLRIGAVLKNMQQRMKVLENQRNHANPQWQQQMADRLAALEQRLAIAPIGSRAVRNYCRGASASQGRGRRR